MRKKRFSLAQLLLAIALTAAAVLGCGLLAVRAWMGEGGRSLVEGLRLVNTLFVGEYDETEVVDAALEGMVSGLGDRWSYYLTADELEAQNQRRTTLYPRSGGRGPRRGGWIGSRGGHYRCGRRLPGGRGTL